MQGSVIDRVGLALACAGRPGSRRVLAESGGVVALPPGWEEAARAEIQRAARMGAAILTPGDAGFPPLLCDAADPPPVLFALGAPATEDRLAIAVVGARRATHWGASFAFRLARDLAAAGFTVTSGLARGIDAAAHRGALAAGGRTLAVLGHGIEHDIYPPEHRTLARQIAEHGALISQFPPSLPPLSYHFPARNRTLAGLALGVVVVEAAERSGSLITAGFAGDLGREVFAVPGRITSAASRGSNGLIRDGARLVGHWTDIVSELPEPWRSAVAVAAMTPMQAPWAPGSDEARMLELLTADEPQHIERLIARAGVDAARAGATLIGLELAGHARQLAGQRWVAIVARARRA